MSKHLTKSTGIYVTIRSAGRRSRTVTIYGATRAQVLNHVRSFGPGRSALNKNNMPRPGRPGN